MTYTKTTWANTPATTSPINADNLNKIEQELFNQDARITVNETEIDNLQNGWNSAGETWTYASVDDPTGVITISGDKTTKYSLGMRIKFTNGGNTIYGIITAISYSSPNTTLTFLHEINPTNSLALHLMANSAITLNYYSNMKAPFGFPMIKDKWSISISADAEILQNNPVIGTYYNFYTLAIPLGIWNVSISGNLAVVSNTNVSLVRGNVTLSTANNNKGDNGLTCFVGLNGYQNATYNIATLSQFYREKTLILTSKTAYYLNVSVITGSCSSINLVGNQSRTEIKAECAYL